MDKGKNKGLIIVIVLLVLIVLGLACYICYDKGVFGKKESTSNNNSENKDNVNEDINNTEVDNYVGKSYSEIISGLDVSNFDKNKFDGKFLVKKVNNMTIGDEVVYYNINGDEVSKYDSSNVSVTWQDIKDYKSDLYKGLDINKKIQYSEYMIYRNNVSNEPTFYLSASKTSYSSNQTIKDSFDNNNIGLIWSSNDNSIKANEVVTVSSQNDNELGNFINSLGVPTKIYKMPDTNRKDVSASDIDFDYIKNYELYWEYEDYYIRITVKSIIKDEKEKEGIISQVIVKSKKSNSNGENYNETIKSLDECCSKYKE